MTTFLIITGVAVVVVCILFVFWITWIIASMDDGDPHC